MKSFETVFIIHADWLFCYIFMCRSDVMGQILPVFGRDWTQNGVVRRLLKL